MKTLSAMAVVTLCMTLFGCVVLPDVLFVTEGNPFQVLQLTDAEQGCPAPRRVCYLTFRDGGTSHGCWIREKSYVRALFPDLGERVIPVTEFRRTMLAEYRNISLD